MMKWRADNYLLITRKPGEPKVTVKIKNLDGTVPDTIEIPGRKAPRD